MEKITLTNMCMIIDQTTNKVVLQKRKSSWKGLAFPGGHVEEKEAIIPSTIREVKEETGLDVRNLQFCGIKHWFNQEKNERYIVFLFKTSTFSGTLKNSLEGDVFWANLKDIENRDFSPGFEDNLEIYNSDKYIEIFFNKLLDNTWTKNLF